MRNGQKRMRGRNNNHRKSQNPLTRVYESNGPDVKIRGTASHVAEKYIQLARDAQTSGDPIAAENYYQHAEHYYRVIAVAQEQFRQNNPNLARDQNEMHAHEKKVRQRNDERRKAEHHGTHELREADVALRQPVMQKMTSLHNEKRDVGVSGSQHGDSLRRRGRTPAPPSPCSPYSWQTALGPHPSALR
jgi:hypothetical protein